MPKLWQVGPLKLLARPVVAKDGKQTEDHCDSLLGKLVKEATRAKRPTEGHAQELCLQWLIYFVSKTLQSHGVDDIQAICNSMGGHAWDSLMRGSSRHVG